MRNPLRTLRELPNPTPLRIHSALDSFRNPPLEIEKSLILAPLVVGVPCNPALWVGIV